MPNLTCTNRDLWDGLAQTDPSVPPPLVVLARFDVPIRVSNNLRKILRKAKEEVVTVEEGRNALIEKHAQRDDAGQIVTFDGGKQTALADPDGYLAELDALMALPVVLADVHPVTFADLGDVKISAEVLEKLSAFVVESYSEDVPVPA